MAKVDRDPNSGRIPHTKVGDIVYTVDVALGGLPETAEVLAEYTDALVFPRFRSKEKKKDDDKKD